MIKREWNKYIHKNRTCGDCQLVTAVNAYYYLTGKTITEKRYMKLTEECKCTSGACINIEKAWNKLGIKIIKTYKSLFNVDHKEIRKNGIIHFETKKIPLPMEVDVWHKKCGFHSVLIVDHEIKTNCVRITNFPWETSQEGWMFKEDLYKFEKPKHDSIFDLDLPKDIQDKLPKEYPYRREKYTYRLFGLT